MESDKQIVLDALCEVMFDLWHEERGAYNKPKTYSHEFQKFCVDKLYNLMKKSS